MRSTVFLSLLLLGICGCGQRTAAPPNIVWIIAEDISPMIGAYGDGYATTPFIDGLAERAILYTNAFATAPICAPARSTLATGVYATSLGTQHLRSELPRTPGILTLPEMLREQAGYFTTLNAKTDYNFSAEGVWDLVERTETPWRGRPAGAPFYTMLNYGGTHEGPGNRQERYEEAVADLPADLFHDPAAVPIPPYYPATPEMRRLWAQYYDLIAQFDRYVGRIFANLEEDGLLDGTIVFVTSDHGHGMPRYKRWLNDTGLRVPLIVHVPEKYRGMARNAPGERTDELVSFVDFVPASLSIAGVEIPGHVQGRAFLGGRLDEPREYVYGARDRADDMYDVARAVSDGRYFYVRHFMPLLHYIQPGRIFGDDKQSMKYLRQARAAGELPAAGEAMFQPKPVEELYDLAADPHELNNLAADPAHEEARERLSRELRRWILETRDTGFLAEPEMLIRSSGSSPYEMARSPNRYDLERILGAAGMVGTASLDEIRTGLGDDDSAVRYWAVIAAHAMGSRAAPANADLAKLLDDPSPSVQIAAAETLCLLDGCQQALPVLSRWVQDGRLWLALQAARSIQLIGQRAKPLVPVIRATIERLEAPPGSPRTYLDFNFASFTGWALEVALENCGEPLDRAPGPI